MKILYRLPFLLIGIAMAMGVAPASATVPPAPPALKAPAATILRTTWSVGDKMIVRGTDWPEGKVTVQVCGNAAVNGTTDCDATGTRGFGIGANHKFAGQIIVGAPPAPCPCVVLVGTNFHEQDVLIPITIKDHPLLANAPKVDPNAGLTTLSLTSSYVRGDWWRDALGISPARIMTVTITNTGGRPTGDGVVDITVGKEKPPTGFAASISFDSLDPGESTSVAARFAVDSFAYGTYNMSARVTSPAAGGEITEQTSTFPGYLLVLLILIVLIVDLMWMARVRRRRHMFAEAEAAAQAARDEAAAAELAAQLNAAAAAAARADAEEIAAREAAEGLIALLASDHVGATVAASRSRSTVVESHSEPPAAPVVETPIVEAPIVEAPIVEAPIVEAPAVEAAVVPDTAANGDGAASSPEKDPATINDYFDKLLGDQP